MQNDIKLMIAELFGIDPSEFRMVYNVDLDTGICEDFFRESDVNRRLTEYDSHENERRYKERIGMLATTLIHPNDMMTFLEDMSVNSVLRGLNSAGIYKVRYRIIEENRTVHNENWFVRNTYQGGNNVLCGVKGIEKIETQKSGTKTAEASNSEQSHESVDFSSVLGKTLAVDDLGRNGLWDSYLYNIAYGLRTPLNTILGLASILESSADDPDKIRECARKIKISGRGLNNLITDVLDMKSLRTGAVESDYSETDITEFAEFVSKDAIEQAELKSIELSIDCTGVVHSVASIDALHMKKIMSNILDNAVKYTPGGGKVCFLVEEWPGKKLGCSEYRFIINDTGIGMSEQEISVVFESFAHERAERSGVIPGTGIGMAIVKQLSDMLGGTIDIKSKKGVGTTVCCSFELKYSETSVERDTNLQGRRILLVEDNNLNREVIRAILESEGILVEEAMDGAMAVDMVYSAITGYYDYILMDIQMPYMNGYAATKEIRQLPDKQKAGVPIIALSANAFEEDRKKSLEAGMDEHLSKPVDVTQLLQVLKTFENTDYYG